MASKIIRSERNYEKIIRIIEKIKEERPDQTTIVIRVDPSWILKPESFFTNQDTIYLYLDKEDYLLKSKNHNNGTKKKSPTFKIKLLENKVLEVKAGQIVA